jgi:hypothetical protein
MNSYHDIKTLDAMEFYGGSFASAIAQAANRADHSNYARLKSAFPDLWEQHEEIAEQLERDRAEREDKQ